ncbi:hypothetical protein TeGR_g6668 [Tetraparma gracilis]|uniref:Uncharacterized protein n=1 Tax=Tetraparma gracilis TaxID=2962635 RepID=A0ABQ6MZF6_9STRA|nr:hypothetical protein TeGR_g6668 [Tetraparma gracilis]
MASGRKQSITETIAASARRASEAIIEDMSAGGPASTAAVTPDVQEEAEAGAVGVRARVSDILTEAKHTLWQQVLLDNAEAFVGAGACIVASWASFALMYLVTDNLAERSVLGIFLIVPILNLQWCYLLRDSERTKRDWLGIRMPVAIALIALVQSPDISFAIIGACFSIVTEVAGKMYVVYGTQKLLKDYKKKIEKGSKVGRAFVRVQAEPGIARVVVSKRETEEDAGRDENTDQAEVGVQSPAEEKDGDVPSEDEDELWLENWHDSLTMLGIRWSREIVVEKITIIFAAFLTISDTVGIAKIEGRTLGVQLALLCVFLGTELIADALLVYALDRWYNVPFLRIPRPSVRSWVFWTETVNTTIPPVGVMLYFAYAYAQHSTNIWLGVDTIGGADVVEPVAT